MRIGRREGVSHLPDTHRLSFLQINLQHCSAASGVLVQRMAERETNIVLIQEPWAYRGKIRGLGNCGGRLFYCTTEERPRAAVLVSGIEATQVGSFCGRDLVAVRICLELGGRLMELIVASAYLPYDSATDPPFMELAELTNYCQGRNIPLILGCDANAHHTVWGSSNINNRGEALLEFLLSTNLIIANIGSEPTFLNSVRQEVIDITLCSKELKEFIGNWYVSREASMSDHRHIIFNLKESVRPTVYYRNPKSTNWDQFREELGGRLQGFPRVECNREGIELAVDCLNSALIESYMISCPLKERRNTGKTPWWNHKLEVLRKRARKALNKALRDGLPQDWLSYKKAQKLYKGCIRRSKRESWRSFCENILHVSEAARLHKVLAREPIARLGSVKLPNGSFTETNEETLRHMLSVHFPGSRVINSAETWESAGGPWRREKEGSAISEIVTFARVGSAIKSFSPYKSPGEDGIYPVFLQKGSDLIIAPLVAIFRACLFMGFVPRIWRLSRVVFIPKVGKGDYTSAKSFRPISLSSFLLKTLERLVDRFVREHLHLNHPLHNRQFAYQGGKSTETALHHLVCRIERALEQKEMLLGAFLDIEGAFDNTSHDYISRALESAGIHPTIRRWIHQMLSQRLIMARLGDTQVSARVNRGCPQGGVLSPLLWIMVMDSLLDELAGVGAYVQAYADDLVVLVGGKFENTVFEIMERTLSIVPRWCGQRGLSVNASKTEIVLFTRKRKILRRNLVFQGESVQLKTSVKYLGVILDSKLTWMEHLEHRVRKAVTTFWLCRSSFGSTWGLQPKVLHWVYTAIIRPAILYGSLVWWPGCSTSRGKSLLCKIQRKACVGITGAMRSTPTRALEVLLGLPPLWALAEFEAIRTAYRLRGWGQWIEGVSRRGHNSLFQRLPDRRVLCMPQDRMVPKLVPIPQINILFPKREDWDGGKPAFIKSDGLVWYTDGSKMGDGSGAGIVGPGMDLSFPLGPYATVFQTEVFAICVCAQEIIKRGFKNKRIYICSDSQAALKALREDLTTSKLVSECKSTLQDLGRYNRVYLTWVPGHSKVLGNEQADELARKGSAQSFLGPEPAVGVATCVGQEILRRHLMETSRRDWELASGMRQAKTFFGGYSPSRTKALLGLHRRKCQLITSIFTGHCRLMRHLWIMGLKDAATCRRCGEAEETPLHILGECPGLARLRWTRLGSPFFHIGSIREIPLGKMVSFVEATGLLEWPNL